MRRNQRSMLLRARPNSGSTKGSSGHGMGSRSTRRLTSQGEVGATRRSGVWAMILTERSLRFAFGDGGDGEIDRSFVQHLERIGRRSPSRASGVLPGGLPENG